MMTPDRRAKMVELAEERLVDANKTINPYSGAAAGVRRERKTIPIRCRLRTNRE
jgi:hypothetical protein